MSDRELHIVIPIPDDDIIYGRYTDAELLAWNFLTAWGEYPPPDFTATFSPAEQRTVQQHDK